MELTAEKRDTLIITATNMAGPIGDSKVEWEAKVSSNLRDLISMFDERSAQNRIIDQMTGPNTDKFVATIVGLEMEPSSKRILVGFACEVDKDHPDGVEYIRTERTDSSQEARDLANYISDELLGHRVVVYKELEVGKDQKTKFRVLRHVVDLGESNEDLDWDELEAIVIEEATKPREKAGSRR